MGITGTESGKITAFNQKKLLSVIKNVLFRHGSLPGYRLTQGRHNAHWGGSSLFTSRYHTAAGLLRSSIHLLTYLPVLLFFFLLWLFVYSCLLLPPCAFTIVSYHITISHCAYVNWKWFILKFTVCELLRGYAFSRYFIILF